MRVQFQILWSDLTPDRIFMYENWELPIPRKGEMVLLWAKYIGETIGLKRHVNLAKKTLCHYMVDNVTYNPDARLVEIKGILVGPVLKD